MMVCGLFAVFWLSFGVLQLPEWQLAASYSTTGTSGAEGAVSVGYNAAIALYLIVWGFTLFTFFVFTLKTNMVFACIFFFVDVGVWCLVAAYWKVAAGNFDTALKLQKVHNLLGPNSLLPFMFCCTFWGMLTIGRRGNDVHCRFVGMVYDCCDDVCGIACHYEIACGGSLSFLARYERNIGGDGEEGVTML